MSIPMKTICDVLTLSILYNNYVLYLQLLPESKSTLLTGRNNNGQKDPIY